MIQSVKVLKNLVGEFVSADTVKEATQKDYNPSIWNNTVDRYSKYGEVKFFKTEGTIYDFNYYAIYLVDGIRFLGQVSYGSSLSNGGFAYGFFTEGLKDKLMVDKLKELDFEVYKNIDRDSLTILSHTEGTIYDFSEYTRSCMRAESKKLNTRFFTKEF